MPSKTRGSNEFFNGELIAGVLDRLLGSSAPAAGVMFRVERRPTAPTDVEFETPVFLKTQHAVFFLQVEAAVVDPESAATLTAMGFAAQHAQVSWPG